jgi:hypothetical protein
MGVTARAAAGFSSISIALLDSKRCASAARAAGAAAAVRQLVSRVEAR